MIPPVFADFFVHYSHEYEIIAYCMLFFIFAAYLFLVWHPAQAQRQQGYCILLWGVVIAFAELWLLSACHLDPEDIFCIREPMRAIWGTPRLVDTLSYGTILLVWAYISYRGGILIYQLLVRLGILQEPEW